MLPSEMEVAERFGVSRMTARRAFENLVAKGRIERRRGVGSIVLPTPLHREESLLRSFSDDMRRRGMNPSSRVIHTEVGTNPTLANQLGLSAHDWIVTIQRVRLADGVPVALETTGLPGEYEPVLKADLEQGSLHEALAALGRTMTRATGFVTARLATAQEAHHLGLQQPAALLVETRLLTDDNGRRLEITESAYVGTRWVMDTGSYVAPPAH